MKVLKELLKFIGESQVMTFEFCVRGVSRLHFKKARRRNISHGGDVEVLNNLCTQKKNRNIKKGARKSLMLNHFLKVTVYN